MARKPTRRWYKPRIADFAIALAEHGHAEATIRYYCALVSALLSATATSSDRVGIQAKFNSYLLPTQQKRARSAWELYQSHGGLPVVTLDPPPSAVPLAVARAIHELRAVGLAAVPKLRWCDLHVDDAVVELHNVPRRGAGSVVVGVGTLRPLLPALREWAFSGNPEQGDMPLIPLASGSRVPRCHDLLLRDAMVGATTLNTLASALPAPFAPAASSAPVDPTPHQGDKVATPADIERYRKWRAAQRAAPPVPDELDEEWVDGVPARKPVAAPQAPPQAPLQAVPAPVPFKPVFAPPPVVPGKRGPKPHGLHSLTYTREELRALLTVFNKERIMGLTPEMLPLLRLSHFTRAPKDPEGTFTCVDNPIPGGMTCAIDATVMPPAQQCVRAMLRMFYTKGTVTDDSFACPAAKGSPNAISLADAKLLLSLTLADVPDDDE